MAQTKKATIKDISERTGLAMGTVSKYLNGKTVKERNKLLLDDAIKSLNYTVDEYARGFITGITKTVGVLLPELDNLFYAKIVAKLELELNKNGYAAIIRESRYNLQKELESINWFANRRVDALIVVPNGRTAEDYRALQNIRIPIIFMDMWIKELDYDFIVVNNRDISDAAVQYLVDKGHKDIAILCLNTKYYTAHRRLKGYKDVLERNSLPIKNELVYIIGEGIETAYNVAQEIIDKKHCTAIYASNYTSTFGALFALNERGVKIPQEMSFLGFDDIWATKLFRPKPAIINQPIDEIGAAAAQRALELIGSKGAYEYKKTYLKCEFRTGDTIADISTRF